MRLYLIRHAQSTNNARPTSQRVEDPDLSEIGYRQAELLGQAARLLSIERLFTSPFRRTLLTTRAIQNATQLTPEIRIDFHELGGCYAGYPGAKMEGRPGMTRSQISAEFENWKIEAAIDETGWWKRQPREEYNAAQLRGERVWKYIRELAERSSETTAIVMHADFKQILIEQFHASALETPRNTAITAIDVNSGEGKIVDYNNVDHLPGELHTW